LLFAFSFSCHILVFGSLGTLAMLPAVSSLSFALLGLAQLGRAAIAPENVVNGKSELIFNSSLAQSG
jgi:hypothetical protein